jgi:transcriptional regulator with XRE-family HTH domain
MTFMTEEERALAALGTRLKELRTVREWTLGDLAFRSSLSQAYLSRIESGERQPSLATLFTLARVLEVSVSDLLAVEPVPGERIVVRAGSVPEQHINDLFYTSLTGGSRQQRIQAARVRVPPDRQGTERYQHEGEEWLYILSGTLQLQVGELTHVLHAGDVAHFDSSTPHRLAALHGAYAEALLITISGNRDLTAFHT